MPRRSLSLEYGGDFQKSPQGGLLIAEDTPGDAKSSNQRIQRLLFTNPQIKDGLGRVIARGDSLFYPDFGVGIGRYIGKIMGADEIAELKSTITEKMAQDAGFARQPAPVITVTLPDYATLVISIQYTTNTGQVFNTPEYTVPLRG